MVHTVQVANTFSGPMDLLLYLVRRDEIDIHDIPVAHLTREYLAEINRMEFVDVDAGGEFVAMASLLTEIKSRLLLPPVENAEDGEAEENYDPREGLVQALLEYKQFKEVATELEQMAESHIGRFSRNAPIPEFPAIIRERSEDLGALDLFSAFQNIARKYLNQNSPKEIVSEEVPTEVRIAQIEEVIAKRGRAEFTRLLSDNPTHDEMVGFFIAILELIRLRRIIAQQSVDFSEIYLVNREAEEAKKAAEAYADKVESTSDQIPVKEDMYAASTEICHAIPCRRYSYAAKFLLDLSKSGVSNAQPEREPSSLLFFLRHNTKNSALDKKDTSAKAGVFRIFDLAFSCVSHSINREPRMVVKLSSVAGIDAFSTGTLQNYILVEDLKFIASCGKICTDIVSPVRKPSAGRLYSVCMKFEGLFSSFKPYGAVGKENGAEKSSTANSFFMSMGCLKTGGFIKPVKTAFKRGVFPDMHSGVRRYTQPVFSGNIKVSFEKRDQLEYSDAATVAKQNILIARKSVKNTLSIRDIFAVAPVCIHKKTEKYKGDFRLFPLGRAIKIEAISSVLLSPLSNILSLHISKENTKKAGAAGIEKLRFLSLYTAIENRKTTGFCIHEAEQAGAAEACCGIRAELDNVEDGHVMLNMSSNHISYCVAESCRKLVVSFAPIFGVKPEKTSALPDGSAGNGKQFSFPECTAGRRQVVAVIKRKKWFL